jgi:hypothetical protein
MSAIVGSLHHTQIIYIAIAIQVEVRKGRIRIVKHLLKLL